MEAIIIYLLKASLGIVLFYTVYWLFLRKETFFNANRVFLASSLIVSLLLPFLGLTYTSHVPINESGNLFVELDKNFNSLSAYTSHSEIINTKLNWLNSLLLVYITGVVIFSLRIIIQCIDLFSIIFKKGTKKIYGLKVVENNKYGLPFSFFNIVFINPNFHTGTDLSNILAHEKVHIRENHWFDLLIVEIFTIVFWFNPFVWLFELSIKQNHEYLADEGVLAQGFSIGRYQAILINQIMGMQIIGITNNLNYSLNKKRIKMMTKMKTPKIRAFRMIWALPVVALLLVAFAKPAYVMDSKTNPTNVSSNINDEQTIKVTGKVLDGTGSPVNGASVILYGTMVGAVTDQNGMFTIDMTEKDKICISFVGYTTQLIDFKSVQESLKKDKDSPILITMIKGWIKLDVNEILRQGKPSEIKKDQSSNENVKSGNKDQEVFVIVEQLPEYPGGNYALAKEIKDKTSKRSISGKIDIGITIDENGITKVFQVTGVSEEKSKELVFIFNGLSRWSPGKQRGKTVPVNYNITINQ